MFFALSQPFFRLIHQDKASRGENVHFPEFVLVIYGRVNVIRFNVTIACHHATVLAP
jgi:hypothetical protein